MSKFGLSDEQENLLTGLIQKVFGEETDLKVYIFGSRATGKNRKNSDLDLALKSRNPDLDTKVFVLRDLIEESKFPLKVDIVNWDKILKEYLPQIKKEKKNSGTRRMC
jgi:predicted nucleotidyltransferase